MYLTLGESIWLTLGLAIPTGGFLLRTFIVFHDCGHGSFMPTKAANRWVGRFTALLVWQPYENWRFDHAVHHGTAGDLDRRGQGDVPTLTVSEYYSRPWQQRLGYRLFRNPLVMFGVGPLWSLMVAPAASARATSAAGFATASSSPTSRSPSRSPALCLLFGIPAFLLVQVLPAYLAGMAGVWLFYVQHQFEDVYWEIGDRWSYTDAALEGSSYLKLPKVLQFFTGNIGLHHVHHLNARVPELQPAGRPRRERGLRPGSGAHPPRQPPLPAAEADRHRHRPAAHLGRGAGAGPRAGGAAGHRPDLGLSSTGSAASRRRAPRR